MMVMTSMMRLRLKLKVVCQHIARLVRLIVLMILSCHQLSVKIAISLVFGIRELHAISTPYFRRSSWHLNSENLYFSCLYLSQRTQLTDGKLRQRNSRCWRPSRICSEWCNQITSELRRRNFWLKHSVGKTTKLANSKTCTSWIVFFLMLLNNHLQEPNLKVLYNKSSLVCKTTSSNAKSARRAESSKIDFSIWDYKSKAKVVLKNLWKAFLSLNNLLEIISLSVIAIFAKARRPILLKG